MDSLPSPPVEEVIAVIEAARPDVVFEAPGVVVSYTEGDAIRSGKKFLDAGLQIAADVALQCDEPDDFKTFRIGLFGLDKLQNVDRSVDNLARALTQIRA